MERIELINAIKEVLGPEYQLQISTGGVDIIRQGSGYIGTLILDEQTPVLEFFAVGNDYKYDLTDPNFDPDELLKNIKTASAYWLRNKIL